MNIEKTADYSQLTKREREVLKLLERGMSMKEAARELRITARTVAFHKYRVMDRLELRTNAELVSFLHVAGVDSGI